MRTLAVVTLGALLAAVPVSAQWEKRHDPLVPRGRDGKPTLTAAAPRARDGKPDLSGVWNPDKDPTGVPGGVENDVFPRYFINVTEDLKPEAVPITPWASALPNTRLASEGILDPISQCHPTGVPGIATIPLPFKIVQTPKLIIILHEENTDYRQIFLDGRKLPVDAEPRFMGYSIGRWEGNVLVVESSGFRDAGWLDRMGHPHSASMRLTERFRRVDAGHLEIDVTVDDPKAFSRPITYTLRQTLLADEDLLEYFCAENEKDAAHYVPSQSTAKP
jgi:hypothetical protein